MLVLFTCMRGTGILWNEIPDQDRLIGRILPTRDDNRPAVVYWLHDESCTRPGDDGYVGVAYRHRFSSRINEHKRSDRFADGKFDVTLLFEGELNLCFLYEFILRSNPDVGWNVAVGGARGSKCGMPRTAETKRKIGDANRGRKRPDLSARNAVMNSERYKHDVMCPHCSLVGRGPTMLRYHFKNCRRKDRELYPDSPYGQSKEQST